MELLPEEIIEYILTDSSLSVADIINFSSTCSKFRKMVNSYGSLWKVKFFQRWPKTDIEIVCQDWHGEYLARCCFEKEMLELLSMMSSKFFHFDAENIGGSQLDFVAQLIDSHEYGYYYLKDFLIEVDSLPLTQALTNKYYGKILLKHFHRRHCKLIWTNLLKLNIKEQTLEKGAMFVTLWCQKYKRGIWNTITTELDHIADLVRNCLLKHYKDHPLKNMSAETRRKWREENLAGNMFEPEDCKAIIWAINYVLFEELRFSIEYGFNDMDRKTFGLDSAFLDRKANPIAFAVIYESTARRLGVKIEILKDPLFTNFFFFSLKWKEDYGDQASLVHDISTSTESLFKASHCPRKSHSKDNITFCNMQQIAQNEALHIYSRALERHLSVKDVLELLLVVNSPSVECYEELSRSYMQNKMDVGELKLKLEGILSPTSSIRGKWLHLVLKLYQETWDRDHRTDHSRTPTVRNRTDDVDFAVGMIVRDRTRHRTGIIYGWTVSWGAADWGQRTPRQVRYDVLFDDGAYSFVPQKNLQILHSPPFISPPSTGRFFDEYCTTFYRPNKELQAEYPLDLEALQKILKKDRQA